MANYDWEIIREEVVAGQLSLKEIARRNGCSDTAIRKKIKENGWKRNLSEKVLAQVRNKLVREVRENRPATDEEIIDAAAERGAAIIRAQRADIERLRTIEMKFLGELDDEENPPTKPYCSSGPLGVTITPVDIPVTERASALQALSSVQHKRIQLERQAYNLAGADNNSDPLSAFSDFLASIDGRGKLLPGDDQ